MKLMSVLVMLSMLFGGTGISVAAAQSSTPGELLFPVKLISEEIQIKLCDCVENQLKMVLMFTQHRFEEIHAVLAENELPTNKAMLQYQNQLKYSLQLALKLNQPEEGLDLIQNMLQTQAFQMQQLKQNEVLEPFQFQIAYMLQYYQEMVETGKQDPQQLQQQLRFEYQYQMGEKIEPIQNMESFQFQNHAGPQGPQVVETEEPGPIETEEPESGEITEPTVPDNQLGKGKGGGSKP
ncbi:MAG: hypothetical protein CL609_08320 [Anaerolineaceae bacterium]|nr:hypothetical protein [Anaerolineaceae bacterium]